MNCAPYVGAFPVGASVLDGPAGRIGTLVRGVEDAAPYVGAFPVGADRKSVV